MINCKYSSMPVKEPTDNNYSFRLVNLTGLWDSSGGEYYYIYQSDTKIWWAGFNGVGKNLFPTNGFHGELNPHDYTITGILSYTFCGLRIFRSPIKFRIISNTRLIKVTGTYFCDGYELLKKNTENWFLH